MLRCISIHPFDQCNLMAHEINANKTINTSKNHRRPQFLLLPCISRWNRGLTGEATSRRRTWCAPCAALGETERAQPAGGAHAGGGVGGIRSTGGQENQYGMGGGAPAASPMEKRRLPIPPPDPHKKMQKRIRPGHLRRFYYWDLTRSKDLSSNSPPRSLHPPSVFFSLFSIPGPPTSRENRRQFPSRPGSINTAVAAPAPCLPPPSRTRGWMRSSSPSASASSSPGPCEPHPAYYPSSQGAILVSPVAAKKWWHGGGVQARRRRGSWVAKKWRHGVMNARNSTATLWLHLLHSRPLLQQISCCRELP
jgi:hypothetical protein